MKAYQPIKDSMGGNGPMPFVYLEKRACEMWASENKEEWTDYTVKEVEVRELTADEGAVGTQLVRIRKDRAIDIVRAKALRKLTKEEREALGLQHTIEKENV